MAERGGMGRDDSALTLAVFGVRKSSSNADGMNRNDAAPTR
jgi:hypothetical protein